MAGVEGNYRYEVQGQNLVVRDQGGREVGRYKYEALARPTAGADLASVRVRQASSHGADGFRLIDLGVVGSDGRPISGYVRASSGDMSRLGMSRLHGPSPAQGITGSPVRHCATVAEYEDAIHRALREDLQAEGITLPAGTSLRVTFSHSNGRLEAGSANVIGSLEGSRAHSSKGLGGIPSRVKERLDALLASGQILPPQGMTRLTLMNFVSRS